MTLATDDAGLDRLDASRVKLRDAAHFRAVIAANEAVARAQQDLRAAVLAAREAGESWTVIGAALDITRQAAQQRFGR
ncbi:hypothetical protein [Microbacterium nanhaiense]|nr:hypothetical protein [Microbacterium nanhaiense]